MIAENDKKWSRFIALGGLILVLIYLAQILVKVTQGARPVPKTTRLMSNMKQIGTGLAIYCLDYDGILPNCITRRQFQATVDPYIKAPTLFNQIEKKYHLPIEFNFNLSGVKIDLPQGIPLSDKANFISPHEAVMLYSIIAKKDESPAVLTYVDTSTKVLPKGKFLNPMLIFGPQFDRSDVSLAPADYIPTPAK